MLIDMNFRGKTVLIIGGGTVGGRKAAKFLAAGAKVVVISKDSTALIKQLAADGKLQLVQVDLETDLRCIGSWISNVDFVISATNSRELNKHIADETRKKGAHVDVVDDPHRGDFTLPVISRVGKIHIAISTGGKSPAMANLLRRKIEGIIREEDVLMVRLQSYARELAKVHIPNQQSRKRVLYSIIEDKRIRSLLTGGNFQEAKNLAKQVIMRPASLTIGGLHEGGKVYLVGAGPGDPGLLTTNAWDILVRADVIVYDQLVSRQILQKLPKHVEKIYVGKRSQTHSIVSQDAIHRTLVSNAEKGKLVVRLKGGDPFLFARGGEDAQKLREAGIKFEVVPGVTSALAVPAYAGIPVTHREYASSVAIVTGHEYQNKRRRLAGWKKFATSAETIIVLMDVGKPQSILKRLVEGGRNSETPVAIVERGTTERQRVTVGTIGTMAEQAVKRKIKPPAVIIVGDVVKLEKELSWFKR